jgi:hypothetical protein
MTVLGFTSPGIHCNFTVNSLPLPGPPVFMRVSRENSFSLLNSLIFSLLIHCSVPDQRINSESAVAPKLRSFEAISRKNENPSLAAGVFCEGPGLLAVSGSRFVCEKPRRANAAHSWEY